MFSKNLFFPAREYDLIPLEKKIIQPNLIPNGLFGSKKGRREGF